MNQYPHTNFLEEATSTSKGTGKGDLSDGHWSLSAQERVTWDLSEAIRGRHNSSPGLSWGYKLISKLNVLHAPSQLLKWSGHALASLYRVIPHLALHPAGTDWCLGYWSKNHKHSGLLSLWSFLFHLKNHCTNQVLFLEKKKKERKYKLWKGSLLSAQQQFAIIKVSCFCFFYD